MLSSARREPIEKKEGRAFNQGTELKEQLCKEFFLIHLLWPSWSYGLELN